MVIIKNIEFPNKFFRFGSGLKIENNEIDEWIKRLLKQYKNNELTGKCSAISKGDSKVIMIDWGNEVELIVAKDYYSYEGFIDKIDERVIIDE